ncbi:MAG: ABC transporter permease subunit [Lachnospiraceae bacterium]|nr:ABC transporter permease subunit [Lachnospiraceae bacterium]MBQ5484999.1 ABC transporter permease subunit [Lachnospiraceae bacterium]
MIRIFATELKLNLKSLLIWSLAVGGVGLACILLYQTMAEDMKEMAGAFSDMGAFSDAFGMSTMSIATLPGYFATEVGTCHGLGSGMFAAILAIGILSKEEEGHTGEFLYSLPVSRQKIVAAKGGCVLVSLVMFTIICALMYRAGCVLVGEELPVKEFCTFMGREFIMNLEIAAVCFFVSSVSRKNRMGLGIGIAMFTYVYDLIGRVVPSAGDYLFIGPYSYANAPEIFAGKAAKGEALVVAVAVTLVAAVASFICHGRRDLAG